MIVGLSGKIGSGKNTVGEQFKLNGFYLDSVASSVKDVSSIIFGFDRSKLEGITKEDREWREKPDEKYSLLLGKNFTPRDSLYLIGTDFGRNQIHPDIWINSVFDRYSSSDNKNLCITDVRLPNEYDYIKKRKGIIIRIERDNITKIDHYNEYALDNYYFDYIIQNNGTLEELIEKVNVIINKIR